MIIAALNTRSMNFLYKSTLRLTMLALTMVCLSPAFSQPTSLVGDVSVKKMMNTSSNPVRIDKDPITNEIYYMTESGFIYKIDTATNTGTLLFSSIHHGLNETYGFEIGATGNIYVAAAENVNGFNIGKVAKGSPDGSGGYTWTLLAETEAYRHSGNRDHKFNAIIESTDGQYVYVNSGSRTDHAEEAKNDGLREMPITSAILKIPVSANNLLLQNDETFLTTNGYIFADGIRNTYDLEYAANGDLFGVENCDTRDNEEELNWLREGHHYGFPWEIGTHQNPQQFASFAPPGSDNLLVSGINMESTFYNDPTFPAKPAGITFTAPVINTGPDAAMIRDSVDGLIKDAISIGRPMGTFTPHSSPVALTFDTEQQLGGDYTGNGFAMSYNASSRNKYTPFLDPGEDLLFLELTKSQDSYTTKVTRIVEGFSGPIDAVIVGNKMYILEYSGGSIYEVTFPRNDGVGITPPLGSISPFITVFPNPFSEEITISSSFDGIQIDAATLYDIQGKELGKFDGISRNEFSYEAIDLIPGVYFIQVETDRGIALKKIVKE